MPSTDPAVAFAGRNPTPELIAQVREQLDLDKPVPVQYANYVKRLVTGDQYGWPGLGLSYDTRSPVRDEIFRRASVTLSARHRGGDPLAPHRDPDRGALGAEATLGRRPGLDGLRAVRRLGARLLARPGDRSTSSGRSSGGCPGTGYVSFADSPKDWFLHMIMPWSVLALLFAAIYARIVRGNMIDTMSEDYIRTARAKGLEESQVVIRHGLRPGLTPVMTLLGIDLGPAGRRHRRDRDRLQHARPRELRPGRRPTRGDLPGVLAVVVLASFAVAFLPSWATSSTPTSTRGCATAMSAAPPLLEVRDLQRALLHRRRHREGGRRRRLHARVRAARSGSWASRAPARASPS